MLLKTLASGESNSEYIHNYYEQMVIEQLRRASDRAARDPEFLADVACVALNHLPPRYVRHNIDMTFFLSPTELDEMQNKVALEVNKAVSYVERREAEKAAQLDEPDGEDS